MDFAGGNVVHITSGFTGLAISIICGKLEREDLKLPKLDEEEENYSSIIIIIGTSLLWFCWLGFNGGSSLKANDQAVIALINSNMGASGGLIIYFSLGYIINKKPSIIDMCIGVLAGLISVTPCAGYVTMYSSIIISMVASTITYFTIYFKKKYNLYRDPLDVFSCHGVSGIVGSLMLAFFAEKEFFAPEEGIVYGGSYQAFLFQLLGVVISLFWSFVISTIILILMFYCKTLTFSGLDDFSEYGVGIDLTDYNVDTVDEEQQNIKPEGQEEQNPIPENERNEAFTKEEEERREKELIEKQMKENEEQDQVKRSHNEVLMTVERKLDVIENIKTNEPMLQI